MDFKRSSLHRLLPAAAALALFFVASALYFTPQFGGEVLPQHDVMQYEGMVKEIRDCRAATGEDPQWTGAMFGGMPAYMISVAYPAQLVKNSLGRIVSLVDTPAGFLFFAMVSMWLMLLIAGVDPWVGTVGALAYGFSTYFVLIIGAGHVTKMWALVYAPLMMGGAWMTLRGDRWSGAAIAAAATSLEIGANHPQITYYFLLAMAAFWFSEAVAAWHARRTGDFLRRTGLLAAAGLAGVLSNFSPLWYAAQHTGDTIRGGSELTAETPGGDAGAGGLDLDYATAWSYGRAETLNLLVPDFMGRDSSTPFSADGPVAGLLDGYGLRGAARQLPAYWGTQPYTAGPTYLGAAALFLAALGLALLRGRDKWWIVAVAALMILLSWGRNFMGLTELAFKLLPGYDKFRTVSMTLVAVQWAVPLLGALALDRLWRGEVPRERLMRALAWAAGVTGGLCLVLAAAGDLIFDFGRAESAGMMTDTFRRLFEANGLQQYLYRGTDIEWGEAAAEAMAAERASMMRADAWRSLALIALAAGAVWLFARRRIGRGVLAAWVGAVVLLDLVPVDRRFLSSEDFTEERSQRIVATEADREILADTTAGFRVLNLTVSPFNDASTSYFHRSVGGYHGAKLSRYQDLIDRYLSSLDEGVLDMLNTRYLIAAGPDGAPEARRRGTEYGAAWFVDAAVGAATPAEEIDLLGETDLHRVAVVAERDMERLGALAPADSAARRTIRLAEYRPNLLRYEYTADREALALFSEIFYDKGWRAYVDGVEAPYLRADYVLRAMLLPAGSHTVEWCFRAPHWGAAEAITLAASLLVLLSVAAALLLRFRTKKQQS